MFKCHASLFKVRRAGQNFCVRQNCPFWGLKIKNKKCLPFILHFFLIYDRSGTIAYYYIFCISKLDVIFYNRNMKNSTYNLTFVPFFNTDALRFSCLRLEPQLYCVPILKASHTERWPVVGKVWSPQASTPSSTSWVVLNR